MNHLISFITEQNWSDIIFSTSFLFTTIGLHHFIRNKVYNIAKTKKLNEKGPLPDIIHINFVSDYNGKYTDIIIKIQIFFFILLIFIYNRIDIGMSFLKIYSILKNFRSLCMSVTILPDISGNGKSTWLDGGTNDLMFSGHILLSTLLERYYNYYFMPMKLKFLLFILNFIIMSNTILTKRHYTIDVIIAWYITYSFFELSNLPKII